MISTNLDSKNNLSINNKLPYEVTSCPHLTCRVNFHPEKIIFTQDGREFAIQASDRDSQILEKLLLLMDGNNSIKMLQEKLLSNQSEVIHYLVQNLDSLGFIDGLVKEVKLYSSIDSLKDIRDLSEDLLYKKLSNNPLWQSLNSTTNKLPPNIIYGIAIEYFYFFAYKATAETSLLNFQASHRVRQLINQLYFLAYEQEKFLLKALETIDINQEQLTNILPLPETMGLCNGLSYWANFEPLFYYAVLDILSVQIWQFFELYVTECQDLNLDTSFIKQINWLVNSLLEIKQKNIAYKVFKEIDHIDITTRNRHQSQIYLFVEMYDSFSLAIWQKYSNSGILTRQITAI